MPNANDQTIPYPASGRPSIPIVGGVATIPAASDDAAVVVLTANTSIVLRTPPVGYRTLDVILVQDATGGRTVTWTTPVTWLTGAAPAPDAAPSGRTRISLLWDNGTWYETGNAGGSSGSSGSYVTTAGGGQERVATNAAATGAVTCDLAAANVHALTLTGNVTLALAGAVTGRCCSLTLLITQDATGGRTITWPGSVKWLPSGSPPSFTTTASTRSIVELFTIDGGTTWFAGQAGTGIS